MSRIVVIGGFERYDYLREELLVLLAWTIFCGFLFLVIIGKECFDFGAKPTYYIRAT